MVINGKIDLACRTQVATFGTDTIILEPLPNFEIIKDLVVEMTPFWRCMKRYSRILYERAPLLKKKFIKAKKTGKKSTNLSIASFAPAVTAPALF